MNFLSMLNWSGGATAGCVIGGIALIILILFFVLVPIKAFFTGLFSRAFVSGFKLASLRFRKIDTMKILEPYILSKKANLTLTFNQLEAHSLSGGNINKVVAALIAARNANIDLSFELAKAIDLSGQDVVKMVEGVIKPLIIEVNDISGVAGDNIELIAKAQLSVSPILNKIMGRVSIETLKARVSKYISTKIGSLQLHKSGVANPSKLTEGIMDAKLDDESGFKILTADAVKIEIGRDIGSEMIAKTAEKDKALAQLEADKARNYAIIRQEQLKAETERSKSEVLLAEAEIPKAIAEAIREGNVSVMDYYKLMNLQADTALRRSLSTTEE